MKVLAENSKRDLFKGANNQLGILTGIEAVTQQCEGVIESQRGEMQYNTARGIPIASTIWVGVPNQQRFQFFCVQALQQIEGVLEIRAFTTEIVDNVLQYDVVIVTEFGIVAIGNIFDGV